MSQNVLLSKVMRHFQTRGDHAWAQLSGTDTKLKYYGGESVCFFPITTPCWKNVCNLRIQHAPNIKASRD